MEKAKAGETDKNEQANPRPEIEDKLSALKEFRKKNELCFKCGNKWALGHKCPSKVPLHVIKEILDALEAGVEPPELETTEDIEETMLAVGHSKDTTTGRRKTLKLCGRIGKMDVLILVDSGSVGTIISTQLAVRLQVSFSECPLTHFVAVDGSPMVCSHQVKKMQWNVQGHSFISTIGVLPLKCFDMILGEDWLESCSPMWIH